MLEVPNDSISQLEAVRGEDGVESYVEWKNLLRPCDVIPNFPADASAVFELRLAELNDLTLLFYVVL